jgi:hypothetical protein
LVTLTEGIIKTVAKLLSSRVGAEITVHDVAREFQGTFGIEANLTTIAGTLKRLESEGKLKCVEPGRGPKPGRYVAAAKTEELAAAARRS